MSTVRDVEDKLLNYVFTYEVNTCHILWTVLIFILLKSSGEFTLGSCVSVVGICPNRVSPRKMNMPRCISNPQFLVLGGTLIQNTNIGMNWVCNKIGMLTGAEFPYLGIWGLKHKNRHNMSLPQVGDKHSSCWKCFDAHIQKLDNV